MRPSYLRLWLIVLFIFLLTIIVLPYPFSNLRPLWVFLFVLYVQVTLPRVFYVMGVVFFGLMLDVLSLSALGQHLLALTLVSWCIAGRARRFKFFSMSQQMVWVFLLSFMYQWTLFVSNIVLGYSMSTWSMLLPVCMTTLVWPWFKLCVEYFLLSPLSRKRRYILNEE